MEENEKGNRSRIGARGLGAAATNHDTLTATLDATGQLWAGNLLIPTPAIP